jgi:hypothetical protein
VYSSRHQRWFPAALLLGALYVFVGRVFAVPVTHVQGWRLAAWLVCGLAFAAHVAYEHFSLRHSPRLVAWHAAVAVAIGAFLLAVAAMIRSLWTTSALRPVWFLAIFLWPAITAVPAFLAALAAAAILARLWPNDNAD